MGIVENRSLLLHVLRSTAYIKRSGNFNALDCIKIIELMGDIVSYFESNIDAITQFFLIFSFELF